MRVGTARATGLFPLGIAIGRAHCNRTAERSELARNLTSGTHTWLWGRRRMGKTSLIEQVLRDLGDQRVAATSVDLLMAHDAAAMEQRLRTAVERVSGRIASGARRAANALLDAFEALAPEVSLSAGGISVRLAPTTPPPRAISELLLGLDRAAEAMGWRVAVVLDEFQQLTRLAPPRAAASLEGAVRHAAERSRRIAYVFCGSQRHLLAAMFEDEERPLFRLSRKMKLGRIAEPEYESFLQQAAADRWGERISADALTAILSRTARHPYYVNALCSRLWAGSRPPSARTVAEDWSQIVEEDGRAAAGRLLRLPSSHRALLRAIAAAEEGVEHPGSYRFLSALRLPTSTGNHAREALERADLIRREPTGRWTLVDPVLAAWLRDR